MSTHKFREALKLPWQRSFESQREEDTEAFVVQTPEEESTKKRARMLLNVQRDENTELGRKERKLRECC